MKILKLFFIITTIALVQGCATKPAPDVRLSESFWKNKNQSQKISIANAKPGEAGLYKTGQQGLLDMVIAGAATSKFTKHLKTTDMKWYDDLREDFLKELEIRGIKSQIYKEAIDLDSFKKVKKNLKEYSEHDLKPLAVSVSSGQLLLIELEIMGAERKYYGPIPIEAPKAICNMKGRLIDLSTNKVLWRGKVESSVGLEGIDGAKEWDQPPNYPNFTESLEQAITNARYQLVSDFIAKSYV